MNPDVNAFQRKFVNEVRRCEEMGRKLRYFRLEVDKASLHVNGAATATDSAAPDTNEMSSMETEFEQLEQEMKEINANEETLRRQDLELKELREILRKTGVFFDEAEAAQGSIQEGSSASLSSSTTPLMSDRAADGRSGQLGFVTGVIAAERMPGFERLLWRACRGNVFLRRVPVDDMLEDPKTGEQMHKEVFIVFFQGEQLEMRVRKICEGYDASVYPCPATQLERHELKVGVETRISDLQMILNRTIDHRRQVLANVAFKLGAWQVKVQKIKAIYHTMNKFNIDVTRKCLIAECWYPTVRETDILAALRHGTERSGTDVPAILNQMRTREAPPTYHVTNRFTEGYQNIVDAYGVASYREVNPTPFTIVTFPFLFAVMFGDCGHGLLMALAAFFLVYKEKSLMKIKDGGEMWNTLFNGRYLVLMMGLFSIYTGFIYNDCFSKSLTLGGSGWEIPETMFPARNALDSAAITLVPPQNIDGKVVPHNFKFAYYWGLDPIWAQSENKLTFTNSYKMKLSVLLGIMQMGFGVVLSYKNHRFFKDNLKLFHMFIPQILFLMSIFGYLCIMIIYKWSQHEFPGGNPPSLLLMLINMFLKMTSPIEPSEVLYGNPDGKAQGMVQIMLVAIALVCVPWMLLVRPLVIRHRMKRAEAHYEGHGDPEGDDAMLDDGHGDGEEEHGFSELMVHQCIETIEFCLGCISNTASYLRLWALSLAHGQLSEVLWDMVLHAGLSGKWYLLWLAFFGWACLTVAVLLIMEVSESCFAIHYLQLSSSLPGCLLAAELYAPPSPPPSSSYPLSSAEHSTRTCSHSPPWHTCPARHRTRV